MQLTLAEVRRLLELVRKDLDSKTTIGGYPRRYDMQLANKLEQEAIRLEQAQIAGLVD